MSKSPDAFRTISEVAEWLDVPTHVLRFWESRFSQIKPVKRAGGRRYYRPSDMRLIGGVKVLLHDQGMTIRAVQKMLREDGIKHVSEHSQPLDSELEGDDIIDAKVVSEDAPKSVAPAPAARGTRDATPAPLVDEDADEAVENVGVLDDEPDAEPELALEPKDVEASPAEEVAEEAPVMFRRATRPAPEPTPASESAPEPEPLPEPKAAPKIPATPNVPDSDPSDDDAAFATDVSVAARITTVSRRRLAANVEALRPLRDQLASLRDRLG